MPSRLYKDRFRKKTMNKSFFLTYRQGLSVAIPGSRDKGARDGWSVLMDLPRSLKRAIVGVAQSSEMAARELVLSNLIFVAYMAYTFATRILSVDLVPVALREFSLPRSLKRLVDVAGSVVGLVLLSPVIALIAIAIKVDSDGPVFFTQMRVGLNRRRPSGRNVRNGAIAGRTERDRRRENLRGMPFKVYKFRSMIKNAERKSGPIWASRNDPRVTRVGAFLRKTRLDEVPQLLNVLKGEMSLVGPRPERPVFIECLARDIADYDRRLDVKPGITGLAQVVTGYDTSVSSVRAKVAQDLRYINSWTLLEDIRILMKTVIVVITGKGAF